MKKRRSVSRYEVSIPHRYGKNEILCLPAARTARFPFLIGTVRTIKLVARDMLDEKFPFLIGTVRTEKGSKSRHNRNVFPFLIGTVRTYS